MGRPFHICEPNSVEPLTFSDLLAYLLFSFLLPALKLLPLCEFPIGSAPTPRDILFPQRESPDAQSVIKGQCAGAVCCWSLPGLAPVSSKKCKQKHCNSAPGDGQDFVAVTDPDKGRKRCSFPHKTGFSRKMGFLTIQIPGINV